MERLVQRDHAAFDELYRRHSRLVYTLCVRVLHDEHEAEQVVIDVFFELWQKAERFHPNLSNPRTYLVMLSRSRAIDRLRELRRHGRASGDAGLSHLEASGSPSERLLHNEADAQVRDALRRLSEDERQALERVYYEGLTHAQVAEAMDAPLGTVKTWVRRALQKVRTHLQPATQDTPLPEQPSPPQLSDTDRH